MEQRVPMVKQNTKRWFCLKKNKIYAPLLKHPLFASFEIFCFVALTTFWATKKNCGQNWLNRIYVTSAWNSIYWNFINPISVRSWKIEDLLRAYGPALWYSYNVQISLKLLIFRAWCNCTLLNRKVALILSIATWST